MILALSASSRTLRSRIGWLAIGQGIEKTAQLLVLVLLVRILPPGVWNTTAILITSHLAALAIGSFNLEQSVLFYLPRFELRMQEALIAKTTFFLFGSGLVVGGAAALITAQITNQPYLSFLIWWAIALEMPTSTATANFVSRHRVVAAGIWDSAHALLQLVLVCCSAIIASTSEAIVFSILVASAIRLIAYMLVFRPYQFMTAMPINSAFREQLYFCIPLGLALATGTLARVVDKWIIGWRFPNMVGHFTIAAQEVPLLSVLPYAGGASVAVLLVKYLSENRQFEAHDLWFHQAELMSRVVVPLFFASSLVAPEAFELIFGISDQSIVAVFQVFTLIGIHRVTEYGAVLRAAGRTKDVAMSGVVFLAGVIVFGLVGVAFAGMMGLTIGTAVAFAIAWWWILGKIGQIFSLNRRSVFPWKTWISYVLLSASVAITTALVCRGIDLAIVRLGIKLFLFCSVIFMTKSLVSKPSIGLDESKQEQGVVNA